MLFYLKNHKHLKFLRNHTIMIKVNQETCIGCGTCVALCPQTFQLNDGGKSEVISQDDTECAKGAVASCPVQAITVE